MRKFKSLLVTGGAGFIGSAFVRSIAADARFVLSGISDPRARLSSNGEFEGYVKGNDLAALTQDFLLVPSSQPNVLLHVVDHAIGSPAPLGLVIADLADRNSPREDAQVARLLGRK